MLKQVLYLCGQLTYTFFCKFSKFTSFLYLLCNLVGCILMSLMLKFTHVQAEVRIHVWHRTHSSYICTMVYLSFCICLDGNLNVNSFILSLGGAFFLFIFTQHLYFIFCSTFSSNKLNYTFKNSPQMSFLLFDVFSLIKQFLWCGNAHISK